MKRITYTFADGEQKEIEVSEEVAEALEEMDRTEHASDEFKRYHCPYSIDAMVYEGSEYSSTKMSPEVLTERAELTQRINKCFDKLSVFEQACKWDMLQKNPCENATVPKAACEEREIWDMDTIHKALDVCDDDMLKLAISLALACCLRLGELLGLTWDCIDVSESSIENGTAHIFVNKELQRVNRSSMDFLSDKDVMLKFPAVLKCTNTVLLLKTPKTKTSVRKVFLPKTVAYMLRERYNEVQEIKELFGDEFQDFNLAFCNTSGRPIQHCVINRAFSKLIRDNNLPKVVFHSLRHSSVTYKLKLNGGDIKSVQGDSGHAQASMVTDRYSHILDDDRMLNAQRMEKAFYSPTEAAPSVPSLTEENAELIKKLLENPQMLELVKTLTNSN